MLTSLILAGLTASTPNMLTSILLIEIGSSFQVPLGIAGQIKAFSSIIAFFSALFLSALSMKYKYRKLLLIGIIFTFLSSLGCGFSLNFMMILLSYSLSGLGLSIILPMAFAIIGDSFPEEERSNAIGYVIAGQAFSNIIGIPIINYISNNWSWRMGFLGYIAPVALASLVLCFVTIPSSQMGGEEDIKVEILKGYRDISSNRSAISCLGGFIFSVFAFQAVATYSPSFFRESYSLAKGTVSMFFIGLALIFIVGSLSSGRIVNRIGRKKSTVLAASIGGVLTIFSTNVSYLILSLIFFVLVAYLNGVRYSSASSLTLEQIPKSRGTMMSLFSASDNLGAALGAGIGGLILNTGNYKMLGTTHGIMGILSAVIFYYLTDDPLKQHQPAN